MSLDDRYLEIVKMWLEDLKSKDESLPGKNGRCSFILVAHETGIPASYFKPGSRHRQLILDQIINLGLNRRPAKVVPITERTHVPTYGELKARAHSDLFAGELSETSLPGYNSALNKWMEYYNLSDLDSTEPQIGSGFDSYFSDFYTDITDRPTASRIKKWANLQRHIMDDESLPKSFSDTLSHLVEKSGKSARSIALAVNVSPNSLSGWMSGHFRPSNVDKIKAIEIELNVSQGILIERLPSSLLKYSSYKKIPEDWWPDGWSTPNGKRNYRHLRHAVIDSIPKHIFEAGGEELVRAFSEALNLVSLDRDKNTYRRDLRKQISQPYRLRKPNWTKEMIKEWEDLKNYKMEPDSFANEDRNSMWAPATALMALSLLERFYGYLSLAPNPADSGFSGRGMTHEQLTIGWLSFPSVVKGYLDFQKSRSKKYNHGVTTFIAMFGSLLRKQSGWIWRNSSLKIRLPQEQRSAIDNAGSWRLHCEGAYLELNRSQKKLQSKGQISTSRDPFIPILPILKYPEPIRVVLEAIKYYNSEIESFERQKILISRSLASKWRNLTLLSLLIRIPLRAKHWTLMTYNLDNTGTLRRSFDGHWHIIIPFNEFKNHKNKDIFSYNDSEKVVILDFSKEPLKSTVPILEIYLEKFWPIISNNSDALFPSSDGNKFTVTGLSGVIRNWTTEYLSEQSLRKCGIVGVLPFSIHAFRDIVATHVIKTTGSVEMAAHILLDSQDIVSRHYARFLPSDRLNQVFQTMSVFKPEER